MGCDIHLHTEVKVAGKWHHMGHPYIKRYYLLFAKMANVRNDPVRVIDPIKRHLGIPEDATELTKLCFALDRESYYNLREGWLDRKQIVELTEWYDRRIPEEAQGLEGVMGYLNHNAWTCPSIEFEDVRFIFWFDN